MNNIACKIRQVVDDERLGVLLTPLRGARVELKPRASNSSSPILPLVLTLRNPADAAFVAGGARRNVTQRFQERPRRNGAVRALHVLVHPLGDVEQALERYPCVCLLVCNVEYATNPQVRQEFDLLRGTDARVGVNEGKAALMTSLASCANSEH